MELSTYMSLVQSQGTPLSPPSISGKDVLQRLNKMGSSFDHMIDHMGKPAGTVSGQRTVTWNTTAGGGSGDLLPGPARLHPAHARRAATEVEGSSVDAGVAHSFQLASELHKNLMQAAGIGVTIDATSTGSKRSLQNLDLLLRGQ